MFSLADVRLRLRQRPFIPLRFITTTGQTYDIHHPDMVLATRRFLEIGLPSADNPSEPDQVTRVAMIHITEIQDLPALTPATGNGES